MCKPSYFFYLHTLWYGTIFTYISGIGVLTPNGSETQRVGIIPDVKIEPTIKGIREGKDEVLDKAIELINN